MVNVLRVAAIFVAAVTLILSLVVQSADAECWAQACIAEDDCEDRDCEVLTRKTKYVRGAAELVG